MLVFILSAAASVLGGMQGIDIDIIYINSDSNKAQIASTTALPSVQIFINLQNNSGFVEALVHTVFDTVDKAQSEYLNVSKMIEERRVNSPLAIAYNDPNYNTTPRAAIMAPTQQQHTFDDDLDDDLLRATIPNNRIKAQLLPAIK